MTAVSEAVNRLLGRGRGGGEESGAAVINVVPDHVMRLLEMLKQIAKSEEELQELVANVLQLEESIIRVLVPAPQSAVLDPRYSTDIVMLKMQSAIGIVEEYVQKRLAKLESSDDKEKLRGVMKASQVAAVVISEIAALIHSLLLQNLPARLRPSLYNNLVGIEVV